MKLSFKNLWSLFILVSILFSCSGNPGSNKPKPEVSRQEVEHFLDSISRSMVPDKREHVLEIEYIRSGDTLGFTVTTDSAGLTETLQKILKDRFKNVSVRFHLLPENSWVNKVGVIRVSVANLRTLPEHSAELASQMLMGMPVKILEKRNGFFRIRTTEGYLGWTDSAALTVMDSSQFSRWLKRPKIIVEETCVSAIRDTLPDSPQVSDMVFNDVAVLLSYGDYFYHIELPDGRRAYIPVEKAGLLNEWNHINEFMFEMKDLTSFAVDMFTGIPYLWGGTSAKGFDCSGFTKNIYQYFGYLLPRDASQQYKIGKKISTDDEKLENVLPGDLLFFGQKHKTKPPKVTHVALYLGNGRIVHATGEVKVESLWRNDSLYNEQRSKSLLGARRIVGYYHRKIIPYYTVQAMKIYFGESR